MIMSRSAWCLLLLSANLQAFAEAGKPVYLEFIERSQPIAHYRLGAAAPEAVQNEFADPTEPESPGTIVQGGIPVEAVPSLSPDTFCGTNRVNGLDYDNRGLRFHHSATQLNSAVMIPGTSIPDFSEAHAAAFTLSVWLKGEEQQPNRAGIVSRKAGDGLDTYQFALSIWDGRYDVIMNQPNGDFRSLYSDTRPDGTWQHVVIVLDNEGWLNEEAGQIRIYVNGEKVKTGPTGNHARTRLIASREPVVIGGLAYNQKDADGYNNGFNGMIDELTLWDRPLTDAEVSDLYKSAIIGRRPMVIIIGGVRHRMLVSPPGCT